MIMHLTEDIKFYRRILKIWFCSDLNISAGNLGLIVSRVFGFDKANMYLLALFLGKMKIIVEFTTCLV